MPGLYKIGYTTRSIEQRLKELCTTGVPEPFTVCCCKFVSEPRNKERIIHKNLSKYRYKRNREFFRVEFSKIKLLFDLCDELDSTLTPQDSDILTSSVIVSPPTPISSKHFTSLDELKKGLHYDIWERPDFWQDLYVQYCINSKYKQMAPLLENRNDKYLNTQFTIYFRGPDNRLAVRFTAFKPIINYQNYTDVLNNYNYKYIEDILRYLKEIQYLFIMTKAIGVKKQNISPKFTSLSQLQKQIIDNLDIPLESYTKEEWGKCRTYVDFQCSDKPNFNFQEYVPTDPFIDGRSFISLT